MSAFTATLDALFADPNLALDCVYRAGNADPGVPVRVILRRPDQIVAYGDTRIVSETVSIDIRTDEVAAPRAGDRIDADGTIYIIQGEPLRTPNASSGPSTRRQDEAAGGYPGRYSREH